MWKKFKWLIAGYSRFRWVLALLLIGSPIFALVVMTQPLVLKYVFDVIDKGSGTLPGPLKFLEETTTGYGLSPATGAAVILVAFAVAILLIYLVVQNARAIANQRLEWEYRQRAFNATTQMGPDFFNKFRTGDLVTRMTDDVAEKLSWFACSGIFRFYEAIWLVIFGIALMLTVNVKLTLFAVLPLPVLIVIFIKTSTLLDKRFETLQVKISNLSNAMESCFSGIRVVMAYNRQALWKGKFQKAIGERRNAEISAARAWAAIESLYTYLWQFGLVVVMIVGGYLAIKESLTIGEFVAFSNYIVMLIFPMFDIGQFLVKGRQSAVSIGRLMEIEEFPPMVRNGNHHDEKVDFREIRFDHVTFSFDGGARNVLNEVDFAVPKGATVALAGKVGSGKSTVINLLTRVADPTSGAIYLDDRPLRELPLDSYREIIGYVPQEPVMFSDTIEENIRFGDKAIDSERIDAMVRLAQLESQVIRFPQGLKTMIGARGMMISGGEKQRVAIARALARNPKILILDDCTSALDARTEEHLWDALHEVMPEMTCFVVTHRAKTLRIADEILLFDDGKVIDRGTHDELIENSIAYRELYSRSELQEQVGAA
jgi:ATP-binding cassette subfamily B protein